MLGERCIDFRLQQLVCQRGTGYRWIILEFRVFGELTNCFHAGVDRHPGSIQNHMVDECVVPIEVECGAHRT